MPLMTNFYKNRHVQKTYAWLWTLVYHVTYLYLHLVSFSQHGNQLYILKCNNRSFSQLNSHHQSLLGTSYNFAKSKDPIQTIFKDPKFLQILLRNIAIFLFYFCWYYCPRKMIIWSPDFSFLSSSFILLSTIHLIKLT